MRKESRKKRNGANEQSEERLGVVRGLALAEVMGIIRHSPEEEGLLLLLHLLAARGEWRIAQSMREYAVNRYPRSPWVERFGGQIFVAQGSMGESAA